jgi:chitodextrinase
MSNIYIYASACLLHVRRLSQYFNRMPHLTFLGFYLVFMHSLLAQEVSVVVPALRDVSESRDAHFNWRFRSANGGSAQVGQFACGSFWVAPAAGDAGVTLISLTGNAAWNDLISCDIDPITERHGLLDGSNHYGSYDGSENIIPTLPLTITPQMGSCVSLVAAMQRNETETSPGGTSAIEGEVADAYCVITVMPEVPANDGRDMIRPNITGTTKEFLTWADFDLSRLPNYGFIETNSPDQWEQALVRWRHSTEIFSMRTETSPGQFTGFSEGGRAFRSHLVINDYASGVASDFNNDVLALFSSATDSEMTKPALAAMLSYGLDIYHARYDYGTNFRKAWKSGAGQSSGQFVPPVFLASLLNDSTKATNLQRVAITNHDIDEGQRGPQELRQIRRGVTGVLLWGDFHPFVRNGNAMSDGDWRYWADFTGGNCYDGAIGDCNPNRGKKTAADPYGYIDGPANFPGTNYMAVSFGAFRGLAAIMILMPEFRSIVNTDQPIEYVDRVLRHGLWTYPDPVAIPSEFDQMNGCAPWYGTPGCSEWGVTWGPFQGDIRYAIEGGNGRFTSVHGGAFSSTRAYESPNAQLNWDTIITLYDGPTYEDSVVPLGTLSSPEIIFESGSNPLAYIHTPHYSAQIRYTTDGSIPGQSSPVYSGPIPVGPGTIVRAIAMQVGFNDSPIKSRGYLSHLDFSAPTVPAGLAVSNVTESSVQLNWTASSDNVGVTGYKVFVDGVHSASVSGTGVNIGSLEPATSYTFSVSAFDASGNESVASEAISATTISNASTLRIVAETRDREIWDTGGQKFIGQRNLRVGGSGTGVDANAVFPFQLPVLEAGERIVGASFSVNLESISRAPSGTIDLYGLPYRTSSMVESPEDYYEGPYGSDALASALDDNFATLTSPTSSVLKTDSVGDVNLMEYINAQYLAGAQGGEFIFLRLNPSVVDERDHSYWVFSSANSEEPSLRPTLVLELAVDNEAPTSPTEVSINGVTESTVDLSWNPSTDNDAVSGYFVYKNGSDAVYSEQTNVTLSGLVPGMNYTFWVTAVDPAGNESIQSAPMELVRVVDVSISPSTLSLEIDETALLSATIYPTDAYSRGLEWSSSDDLVAVVDEAGLVTAVASGTATISVHTTEGGFSADCPVDVSEPVPTFRNVEVVAHADDREIWDTGEGKFFGQQNMRIGGSGSNVDACAVFPFELPELSEGERIVEAHFSLYLESISGEPAGSLDLYGLNFRDSSTVSVEGDFFEGPYGEDPDATALVAAFATELSAVQDRLTLSEDGRFQLIDYLNAQYEAGANGGDFVFLRLNPSVEDEENYRYWVFGSANATEQGARPILSLEISN